MALRGDLRVLARLMQEESRIEAAVEAAAAQIAGLLEQWARTEHAWQNQRPHTVSTISAHVEGGGDFDLAPALSADTVLVILEASYDAGLWLELFHGGEWSWLWPTVETHRAEIVGIMLAALAPWGFTTIAEIVAVRNPDVATEAASAEALMESARTPAHTRRAA